MRRKKYHLYLMAEERRYIIHNLFACCNKLLAKDKIYRHLIDEDDSAAKISL